MENKFNTNDMVTIENPNEKNKNEWFERSPPT